MHWSGSDHDAIDASFSFDAPTIAPPSKRPQPHTNEDFGYNRIAVVQPIYQSESPEPEGPYSFDLSPPAEMPNYDLDSSSCPSSPLSFESHLSTPSNQSSLLHTPRDGAHTPLIADQHLLQHYKQLVQKLEGKISTSLKPLNPH